MSAGILDLNDSNFAQETSGGVVLVDFWAPWCGPCRMQGPILEQMAGQVTGKAKIAKVNVDEAPGVAAQFGIMSIPTLLILKEGKPVKQFVGVQQAAALVSALEAAQ
ncbi:MAG TPA: thioredoxin [Verrucomicrobia bacterium]|nr:MAG: thioredoxin [Lentisphaerae bacterium GWF2_57_35]HBA82522.1 thioredoxin [Verrucomicrobiota bacterium]